MAVVLKYHTELKQKNSFWGKPLEIHKVPNGFILNGSAVLQNVIMEVMKSTVLLWEKPNTKGGCGLLPWPVLGPGPQMSQQEPKENGKKWSSETDGPPAIQDFLKVYL